MKNVNNENTCKILFSNSFDYNCTHDRCYLNNLILNENKKIIKLSVQINENLSQNLNCIILNNEDNFEKLLSFLDSNGFINIFFKKKPPKAINKILNNKIYNCTEYMTNKDFTIFFPKSNLKTIYYYYSTINIRPKTKINMLKFLVDFKFYKLISFFYSKNKCIVLQKK